MQKVPIEELIENKVLPFSLYDSNGEKIFDAGDVLTPGKLMQIQQLGDIFQDENEAKNTEEPSAETKAPKHNPKYDDDDDFNYLELDDDEFEYENIDDESTLSLDIIDITNFKSSLNKKCKIDPEAQLKFKAFHIYILNSLTS